MYSTGRTIDANQATPSNSPKASRLRTATATRTENRTEGTERMEGGTEEERKTHFPVSSPADSLLPSPTQPGTVQFLPVPRPHPAFPASSRITGRASRETASKRWQCLAGNHRKRHLFCMTVVVSSYASPEKSRFPPAGTRTAYDHARWIAVPCTLAGAVRGEGRAHRSPRMEGRRDHQGWWWGGALR